MDNGFDADEFFKNLMQNGLFDSMGIDSVNIEKDRDTDESFLKMAKLIYSQYNALIIAGFDEGMALFFTKEVLNTIITCFMEHMND